MNSIAPFPDSGIRQVVLEKSPLATTGHATPIRNPKAETLKIVVVGTPKTGNTWVKHLLAETYGLPPVKLKPEFDPAEVESAGPRWISHQHFMPSHDLVAWGAANHVAFVSVVRHPGDVLVSLWHHMQNHPERAPLSDGQPTEAAAMLRDGAEPFREHTRHFVEHGFHFYLNLSIAWLSIPGVRAVRYEDLWECPVEALRALTAAILPVPDERLRFALCACELGLMQSLLDPDKKFLRQGGTGGWRTALPAEIKRQLASLEPYPAQFAALGYTMDESHPANTPRPAPERVVGPFGADRTFADGTPVAPVLMKVYFDLPPAQRERWPDPRSTAGDSFFSWLQLPAAADPRPAGTVPVITELAHCLHSVRPDLRKAFPKIFIEHRAIFYDWLLVNARQEYGLDRLFVPDCPFAPDQKFADGTPVARLVVRAWFDLPAALRARWPEPRQVGPDTFFSWLNAPAAADPAGGSGSPLITELAAYLHSVRADIRGAFPDLFGRDRLAFFEWFLANACKEYGLDRAFVPAGPFGRFSRFSDGTLVARILVRAYLDLPEAMRHRWPDPTLAGMGSFLAWLNSPAAADPAGGMSAPVVTELGAFLHSIRPDVRTSMPDLYGVHRVDYSKWFLSSAAREYDLDRAFTLPVILSWAASADRVPPHVCRLVRNRRCA